MQLKYFLKSNKNLILINIFLVIFFLFIPPTILYSSNLIRKIIANLRGLSLDKRAYLDLYKDYSIANLTVTGKFNEMFFKKFIKKGSKIVIKDETFTYGGLYSYISTILTLLYDKKVKNETFSNHFIQRKYDRNILRKKYGII